MRSKKYESFLTQRRDAAMIGPTKSYELLNCFSIFDRKKDYLHRYMHRHYMSSTDMSYPQGPAGRLSPDHRRPRVDNSLRGRS